MHTSIAICVGNLSLGFPNMTMSNSTIFITWRAPLTVQGVQVAYCVDVVKSSSSISVHSQCGIRETMFSYPIPSDAECQVYNFVVTPVALVGMSETATWPYQLTTEGI